VSRWLCENFDLTNNPVTLSNKKIAHSTTISHPTQTTSLQEVQVVRIPFIQNSTQPYIRPGI
jgi:hypothetical protein